MSPPSLAPPLRQFSVTMAVSLTIPASTRFFLSHGVHLRMSCPYTSTQNDKAERRLHSLNDVIRSLLFQASRRPSYWLEALHYATYLCNILPTETLDTSTSHEASSALFLCSAIFVCCCACYFNLPATVTHKLAPRSTLCIFLGYSDNHKGYRCFDPASNRVLISRHVIYYEHCFPFSMPLQL